MLPRLHILVLGWLAVAVPLTIAQLPEAIPTPPEAPKAVPASVTPPTSAGLFDPASLTPDSVTDYWGRFRPRGTYRYDSGDSIGRTGGLSSLQAFVPFWEPNSLQGLAFVDARFLLFDNQTTPGTNVGMGFRSVVPVINRTLGGHLSYDVTDTGPNVFQQVSGGVEVARVVGHPHESFGAHFGIEGGHLGIRCSRGPYEKQDRCHAGRDLDREGAPAADDLAGIGFVRL